MVIGEPNFSASLLPWHNLLFWFSLQHLVGPQQGAEICQSIENGTNRFGITHEPNPFVMPRKATLRGVAVHYHELWKIRAPLHDVEGFDMKHFDNLIMVIVSFS